MDKENFLICPICKTSLYRKDRSLICEKNHSYDFAKSGYINLLNPGKMNNARAGDSKEMISARTRFFESGCYEMIRQTLCEIVSSLSPSVVVDAGCGEGYYTAKIGQEISGASVIGFDMSKFGCEHGAKYCKNNGITNTSFAVSNIFDLPLLDGVADVIVNAFAPVADAEFSRILRMGGYLIVVSAGEKHLDGLKKVIYDEVYLNEPSEGEYPDFDLVRRENISYSTTVYGKDTIWSLFQMTPYFHRTSLTDKAKLEQVDKVDTTVEVDFWIYKKIPHKMV